MTALNIERYLGCCLRAAAIATLVLAVFPRGGGDHERLLVLALEGVGEASIRGMVGRGAMPATGRLIETALGGPLDARAGVGATFWATVLAGGSPVAVSTEDADWIWRRLDRAGGNSLVLGIPGSGSQAVENGLGLAGPDLVDGFIGGNLGEVVAGHNLSRGALPWPYGEVPAVVRDAAQELGRGRSSRWFDLEESGGEFRRGVFKVLRLDRSTFYLTPVYRNAWQPEDAEMRYVADQPSWIGGGSRLSAYYYAHIADLAGQRGRVAVELVRRPWQFMVYYEPVLGAAAEVYAHSSPERLKALYSEVDSTIANLLRLAGPRTVVVLVGSGSEGMGAAAKDKGFFFLSGLPGSTLSMPVSPYDITPTLDHLLGVETPAAGRRGKPMGEVLNRSWDYEAWRLMAPAYDPNDVLGLDAGSLAEIGALSDRIVYP